MVNLVIREMQMCKMILRGVLDKLKLTVQKFHKDVRQ